MSLVFGAVLFSFLLGFLAQLWSVAKAVAFLSLVTYYRPLLTIQAGGWPWGDMGVLAGLAALAWALGAWNFRRRDVLTC